MGIVHLVTLAASVAVATYVLPGVYATWQGVLVLTIALAVLNTFIKPLITLITLPLTILTLGLFSLVVNAGLVLLAAYVVPGVSISGFLTAVLFSIVVTLVNALFAPLRWL